MVFEFSVGEDDCFIFQADRLASTGYRSTHVFLYFERAVGKSRDARSGWSRDGCACDPGHTRYLFSHILKQHVFSSGTCFQWGTEPVFQDLGTAEPFFWNLSHALEKDIDRSSTGIDMHRILVSISIHGQGTRERGRDLLSISIYWTEPSPSFLRDGRTPIETKY